MKQINPNYNKKFSKKKIEKILSESGIEIKKENGYVEEFKQIKYDGKYIPFIISSFGRIFSIYYKGSFYINLKELKTNKSKQGYIKITLSIYHKKPKSYQIHVLVAKYFIKNSNKNKTQVNHKDGIKTHNYVWNLEWCTPQENVIHAEKTNLCHHAKGIMHGRNKHDVKTIKKVCKMSESNKYTTSEISEKTGLSSQLIMNIYKKKCWVDVSDKYNIENFSNYEYKSDEYKKARKKQIEQVCELLENGAYSMKEISEMTGVTYKIVNAILRKSKYVNISDKYDFSNFSNYKYKK